MTAQFKVDVPGFVSLINSRAIVFGQTRQEAFKTEARLLAEELIKRTPPFSGKAIVKMLGAQGKNLGDKNVEITEMSARRVGERRVRLDIERWLYGIDGAKNWNMGDVYISQNLHPNNKNYAKAQMAAVKSVLQKVRGKDVARVFATKDGRVYGVDLEMYRPKPDPAEMDKIHGLNRDRRGRGRKIPSTGLGTAIGRWTFINKMVVPKKWKEWYIKLNQKSVGQGKGGWAAAFMRFGGKMSMNGWIGKWARKSGRVRSNFTDDQIVIEFINMSRWASSGDYAGIIPKAIAGRAESLKAAIWRQMNDAWKKGGTAGRANLPA